MLLTFDLIFVVKWQVRSWTLKSQPTSLLLSLHKAHQQLKREITRFFFFFFTKFFFLWLLLFMKMNLILALMKECYVACPLMSYMRHASIRSLFSSIPLAYIIIVSILCLRASSLLDMIHMLFTYPGFRSIIRDTATRITINFVPTNLHQ